MFRKSTSNNLVVFGAGLVAGWVVKQLFDSPEFKPQKDRILSKASELRERLTDSDEAERIKEIFGKTGKEVTSVYHEAKESLINELDTLKLSIEEIDKGKYVEIVTAIGTTLKNDQRLPEDQVQKLSKALIDDFKKLRERRKDFKKTRNEIAQEIEAGVSSSTKA